MNLLPKIGAMEAKCFAWNERHAIGSKMTIKMMDRFDEMIPQNAVTRSKAELKVDRDKYIVVVWLEGFPGCVNVDLLTPGEVEPAKAVEAKSPSGPTCIGCGMRNVNAAAHGC